CSSSSPLFSYTTLFRSAQELLILRGEADLAHAAAAFFRSCFQLHALLGFFPLLVLGALVESDGGFQHQEDIVAGAFDFAYRGGRSEEHTSELQSPDHLV